MNLDLGKEVLLLIEKMREQDIKPAGILLLQNRAQSHRSAADHLQSAEETLLEYWGKTDLGLVGRKITYNTHPGQRTPYTGTIEKVEITYAKQIWIAVLRRAPYHQIDNIRPDEIVALLPEEAEPSVPVSCSACHGTGFAKGDNLGALVDCPHCQGKGSK